MRVALLHSRYSARVPSGENVVVDAEYAALRAAGIDVQLFQTDPEQVRDSRWYPVRAGMRVITGVGSNMADALERFGPDIVHVHNVFPDLGERSVAGLPFPLVVTAHNYRWGCAIGTFFRDGAICTDCVDGLPLSGVRHGCHHGALGTLPIAVAHWNGPRHNPLAQAARGIWCPSDLHRRKLILAGVPEHRISVSPHFLPDRLVSASGETPRDRFIFVGRLEPEKGVLELARHWPDDGPHLDVVGDGSQRQQLESLASGKPITVHGQQKRERVMDMVAAARGLVFSSGWWETFGLVAMEAMASGTPVLTWGEHAVAELVAEHDAGVLIPDVTCLEAGTHEILARTVEEWRHPLRATFAERFSEQAWVQRRMSEYESALDRR